MQPPRRLLGRVLVWPLAPALLVSALLAELARRDAVPTLVSAVDLPLVAAMVACWVVGVVVSAQAPGQRAGWAFVGLGTAISWSVFCDEYAELGRTGERAVPAWRLVAALGDTSFVWWFVLLTLVLLHTPPGPRGRIARLLPRLTVAAGVLFQAAALLRATPLDTPYENLSSPLATAALDRPARVLAAAAVYALPVCLVLALVLLVGAWRRSDGETRRQLLWLVAGALPLAPCVIAAFALSAADREVYAAALLGGAVVSLVLGAGMSVLRYRLYDVERVLTESAAYAIASAAVLLAYLGVVVVLSRSGNVEAGSPPATILATVTGVAAARVSYGWARRAVGRRVSPQRFRAVETIRAGLAGPSADLDEVMRRALGPHARVLYPAPAGAWVGSDGRAARAGEHGVDTHRRGALVARLEFDPLESPRDVVEAAAREATTEMDNVGLRAELARQVEVIRASRARLETAHQEERRRIERDLHDGAQQRVLAIAFQLRSARLNGDAAVLAAEADRAIADLQQTVRELRDLAAGLQPAALAGGGLLAAVTDLAARAPVALSCDVLDARLPAGIESAAWFVVAEAVTNAVKHSGAEHVAIRIRQVSRELCVRIRDEGRGGADPAGGGLQGLADRVSAVGGVLTVRDTDPHGTVVEARFPCTW